jgi:hypothetical protein
MKNRLASRGRVPNTWMGHAYEEYGAGPAPCAPVPLCTPM